MLFQRCLYTLKGCNIKDVIPRGHSIENLIHFLGNKLAVYLNLVGIAAIGIEHG